MSSLFVAARQMLGGLHREERGQDAFEYLLVIGGVSVVVVLAMVTPVGTSMINAVVSAVQAAVIAAI